MSLALQPSFDDLSAPLFDVTFCTLDLETTGSSAADCEITEIGAVKHRGGEVVATFQTLVDPGAPIPPSITILTGITQAMVLDAPRIVTALPSFLEFLGDAVIVGHNIRFDMSFLQAAARRTGYPALDNTTIDTVALARRLVRPEVRNLRLKTLAGHFRSPTTPNHRALEDAKATAHVFHALLERAGSLGVTNLDDLILLPRARGAAHYSKIRLTQNLPRRAGVYLMKDRHGTVIYVGKANNLRTRVRQYFYGDTRRTIENMMRELHAIDYQVCPTDLEAEITEVRLIHAHRPRYNRRSRPPKSSHFVKVTREAFPRLSVVRTVKEDGLAYLGPFRSKKAADVVVTAIWDSLPVRRCRTRPGSRSGPCASAQLGVAMCPCDGSLSADAYGDVVRRLVEGLADKPENLLEPLEERMRELAESRRYEEAGWARDRHDALARAIAAKQRWNSLVNGGIWEVESSDGTFALIDHGRLLATWDHDQPPPLRPLATPQTSHLEVPPNVETAEETRLVWRWLERSDLRLINATGSLAVPTRVARPLASVRRS